MAFVQVSPSSPPSEHVSLRGRLHDVYPHLLEKPSPPRLSPLSLPSSGYGLGAIALAAVAVPALYLKRSRAHKSKFPCRYKHKTSAIDRSASEDTTYIADALKLHCDLSGAAYAIYWMQNDVGHFVREYYDSPELIAKLKSQRGDNETFASRCRGVRLDSHPLVSGVATRKTPVFIKNVYESSKSARGQWFNEFGINSICMIPLADGVLEYGSDLTWEKPPAARAIRPSPTRTLKMEYQRYIDEANTASLASPVPSQAVEETAGVEYTFAQGDKTVTIKLDGNGGSSTELASKIYAALNAEKVLAGPPASGHDEVAPSAEVDMQEQLRHATRLSREADLRKQTTDQDLMMSAQLLMSASRCDEAAVLLRHLRDADIRHLTPGSVLESQASHLKDEASVQLGVALANSGRLPEAWEVLLETCTKPPAADATLRLEALANVAFGLADSHVGNPMRQIGFLQRTIDAERATGSLPPDVKIKLETSLMKAMDNQREVVKSEAARKLVAAQAQNTVIALEPAIGKAASAGVDSKLLSLARSSLRKLYASEELEKAIQTPVVDALSVAIDKAKLAGVTGELLVAASAAYQQAFALVIATEEIKIAMDDQSPEKLEAAIAKASAVGVDADIVNAALRKFSALVVERKISVATENLQDAMEVNTPEALTPAIHKAKSAGVDDSLLDEASAALFEAREEVIRAKKAAEAAMILQGVLDKGVPETYGNAIKEAEAAGVGKYCKDLMGQAKRSHNNFTSATKSLSRRL